MKKILAGAIALAGVGLAGMLARQAVERDHEYRRLVVQGDEALSRGQTFVAIEAFSGAIALKHESMLAYLKRGEAHRRRGDSVETLTPALRDLRTAAELDPGATRVQEELGDVNFQLRRYANAAENYEAYLRLDDRSAPVLYKLSLAARADGRFTRAISALQSAIRLNPSFAEAHYLLGLCLKDTGKLRDAQKAFRAAITIAPALIPAREELADLYRLQGDGGREIDQLQALAALDPSRPERLIAVGQAYARHRNHELAVTVLGQAAERFHEYPGVHAALGRIWLSAAEEDDDEVAVRKALEALEPIASQPSATSEILGLYGRALALDGRREQSEHAFRQAMDKFPIDPAVLPQLASLARRLGHLDDARQALVRYTLLVDDDPDLAVHASQIGDLSLALNDPDSAASWYEKAVALTPSDATALAHLADAELQAGRVAAAQETIARAAGKNPRNALVRAVALRIQRVAQPVSEEVKAEH